MNEFIGFSSWAPKKVREHALRERCRLDLTLDAEGRATVEERNP
jgi:hypothetical protein